MYQIIVNPSAKSGHGKKNWEEIKSVLDKRGLLYAVYFTHKGGDAAAYVKELYRNYSKMNDPLHLIVLGGDGTMNEVINGLPGTDNLSMTCIPVGSSNDLARALGISFDPKEAITHVINTPDEFSMDIGILHGENSNNNDVIDRRFLVSAGIGYDAAICAEANTSKVKKFLNRLGLGKLSYLAICLKQLAGMTPISATLSMPGKEDKKLDTMILTVAMNNKFEGGGFKFAPDADNSDGMQDICYVSNLPKSKIPKILPEAMKGDHFKYDGVDFARSEEFTIKTSAPVWIHTDGEADKMADTITVSTLKQALKMIK